MATARKINKIPSLRLANSSNTAKSKKKVIRSSKRILSDSTRLMNESKKLVSNLYQDGNRIIQHAGNDVKAYSDDVLKKVQKNPLTSLLVSAGVGLVLSLFLRRK